MLLGDLPSASFACLTDQVSLRMLVFASEDIL
jgi:hypothetical protein